MLGQFLGIFRTELRRKDILTRLSSPDDRYRKVRDEQARIGALQTVAKLLETSAYFKF
jgi:hypothetical protein